MNRKIILGLILLSVILVGNNLGIALADWDSISITPDSGTSCVQIVDSSFCTGVNGRIFYSHQEGTNLMMEVYSSDGSLLQEKSEDITWSVNIISPAIYTYNSTHILMFLHWADSTDQDLSEKVRFYDIASNSYTDSNKIETMGFRSYIHDEYYTYNDNLYFIANEEDTINVFKYVLSSNTLSRIINIDVDGGSDNIDLLHIPLVVQDEDNPNILIVGGNDGDMYEYPEYYKIDLESESSTHLADHPLTDDRIGDNYSNVALSSENYDRFLGGGVEYEGDNVWVWFNWLHPYNSSGNMVIRVIQHRLVFNGTISSGNLIAQNERDSLIQPTVDISNHKIWSDGYMVNKSFFKVYYPVLSGGSVKTYYSTLNVTDWYDYTKSALDFIVTSQETDEYPSTNDERDILVRDFGGNSGVMLDASDNYDSGLLYYGFTALSGEYDISLTYSPVDNPLIVDKSYSWILTLTFNDVGVKRTVALYIDGLQQSVTQTSSSGTLEFTFLSGISGVRTWKIDVLDADGDTIYTESFSYTWSTGEEGERPASDVLLPTAISSMVQFFVPLVLIGAPMMTLGGVGSSVGGSSGGTIGFIVGGILGVAVTIMVGWFPNYLNYLLILAIISGVVLLFKGGN